MKRSKKLVALLMSAMLVTALVPNVQKGAAATSISSVSGISMVKGSSVKHPKLLKEKDSVNVSFSDSKNIGTLSQKKVTKKNINRKKVGASTNSVTETYTDVFSAEGDATYVELTLAPGEIVHASLVGPNDANINYDVLLYTIVDGGLGTCVAGCALDTYMNTYSDGATKSVSDSFSYINSGEDTQSYAIFVVASTGYSETDPFYLTVSINESGYDSAEPNDNPFTSTSIAPNQNVAGNNLDMINDYDWYVWQMPSDYSKVRIDLSNFNYELYYAVDSSMILVQKNSSNLYSLSNGYYYICVDKGSGDFVSADYTLKIQPCGTTPAQMQVAFNGDQGTNKVNYGYGLYHRAKGAIYPTVTLLDASGYPVPGKTVNLIWLNESWSGTSANYRREGSETTGADGKATIHVSLPPAVGTYSYTFGSASPRTHYFDIAAFGVSCGSLSNSEIMYHFAYTDSAY